MKEVFYLSDSGSNYYFDGNDIFGVEGGTAVKYSYYGKGLKKEAVFFGGLKLELYDGKRLIAQNKTFYITE